MSYKGAVNIIRAVAEAVNPDGFFQHGRKWEASLNFGEANQQIYLYPISASVDIGNHYYESWKVVLGIYFKDTPDSSPTEMEDLIDDADIIARLFLATIDNVEALDISNVQLEPRYRDMAGTYSGMYLSFNLGTTSNLCVDTVEDVVIPPAQTLCEAIRACVGNVQYVELTGNNTTTITATETIGKEILFVSTDGRIRKTDFYTHNSTTGAFVFGSVVQSTQTIYILYK